MRQSIVEATINPIPDILRMRGVQGRSRSKLLQTLDNAANERLAYARRMKIFIKYSGQSRR